MARSQDAIRFGLLLIIAFLTWHIIVNHSDIKKNLRIQVYDVPKGAAVPASAPSHKCGLPKSCARNTFAFLLRTGAANAIGPRICFEGEVIMSSVLNNIGHGLNIVVANGDTGKVKKMGTFNTYSGDPEEVVKFLKDIDMGMIVLVASFDDSATKLTPEIRKLFSEMGSTYVDSLAFRDGWLFAGATGMEQKTPFEKLIKNNKDTNLYDGWPEIGELAGCFPMRI